jgi:hypothetical protein
VPGWNGFAEAAPELAAAGRRLLVGDDGNAIAFLSTLGPATSASAAGEPHLGPVCPIFCQGELYLSAGQRTPKVRDLRSSGRYVLHAFLGGNDEEFQIAGTAAEVSSEAERGAVHAAIPFAAFDTTDPIFRFGIERALWVHWERVGQPDTRAVRRRWREDPA